MSLGLFYGLLSLVSAIAGMLGAISGFGIDNVLTPLLALNASTKLSVLAVAAPSTIGSAYRFWLLRSHVETNLLFTFGLLCAVGGLIGSLLQTLMQSSLLGGLLGMVLVLAGISGMANGSQKLRFEGWSAWAAGGVSGLLGGLIGNQGGILAAALLGMGMKKHAFVATVTAIALVVDTVRTAVYIALKGDVMAELSFVIVLTTLAVMLGTWVGYRVLRVIPDRAFRPFVAVMVLVLAPKVKRDLFGTME